jgi:hypothetical protein
MQLRADQKIVLRDSQQRPLGQIAVERTENDLVFGQFEPGAGFPAVASLFHDFEEAVNLQALAVVDQLDAVIASLGLYLCSPDGSNCLDIHDVQIGSDGSISFRRGISSRNGLTESKPANQPAKTS